MAQGVGLEPYEPTDRGPARPRLARQGGGPGAGGAAEPRPMAR